MGHVYFSESAFWPLNTTLFVRDFHGNHQRFVYYLLASLRLERFAASTGVPSLNRNFVHPLVVTVPPPREQRRIAAILDAIDEAIERTEAMIAATERLRDALLHDLLTLGVPGWHSEWRDVPGLGVIPSDWEVVRLGEVAEVRNKQIKPVGVDSSPYVALEHIVPGGLLSGYGRADDAVSNKTVFYKGDTLYGKLRPNLRKVIRARFNGLCSSEILVLSARDMNDGSFMSHLIKSDQLHSYAMQGITGTKMPRTSWGHLRGFEFPLPPLPEQRTIADMLDSVDDAIGRAREERDGLQSLQASASDALLTGRVRIS